MSVVTFKTGLISEMFDWKEGGYIYLPSWVREIGSMLQLMPLLIVPFVGVIQTCRYFLHGPDDLFDVSFQYMLYAVVSNMSGRIRQGCYAWWHHFHLKACTLSQNSSSATGFYLILQLHNIAYTRSLPLTY